MSIIFQYTSLEVLALIIENKTIRFTNLCKLDDPLEKYVQIKEYDKTDHRLRYVRSNYGKYCFVSCWTKNESESISMWDMYGDRKQGVRIGLPPDMFDVTYNINERNRKKNVKQLFPIKDEYVMPEYLDVDYSRISDPKLITEDWKIEIGNLGRYKTKDWEFQNECRFRLFACKEPNKKDVFFSPSRYNNLSLMLSQNPSSRDYVDFRLNENVLRQIKIVRGPQMSEGKKLLLDSLIKKYEIKGEQVSQSKFWVRE